MATTTTSKQWRLNAFDFGKALIVAAITPVVPIIAQSMSAKAWVFDWTTIWHTAAAAAFAYLVKNFFTPAQTIITPVRVILVCLCLSAATAGHAQSPFKPLSKIVVAPNPFARVVTFGQKDSTVNAWRFIADIAAYSEPGNILMAGVGYGYQHLQYDYASQKWVSKWSVSAVGFAGGSVAPTTPASIASFGIMGGINNNLFMAGPVYNPGTKQFGIAISIGINLNN